MEKKEEEHLIVPITPEDFERIRKMIGKRPLRGDKEESEEFCPVCSSQLVPIERHPFKRGIFYKCPQCSEGKNQEFIKRIYGDFRNSESFYRLEPWKGL